MLPAAYVGPQQELAPLVRRGDLVRFQPRRGARRWVYVRVTSHICRRSRFSARSAEWASFTGRRVRCYAPHEAIGPDVGFDVKVADLHRLPRRPVRFATADGRLRVDVISLEHSGAWYRVTQRAPGGPVLVAEVRSPGEVSRALRSASLGRVGLADLAEVTP
jgi:hypothetical protein